MSRKRKLSENVVFENIDRWLEEEGEDGEDDNLQELYTAEDMDDEDAEEELNATVVELNVADEYDEDDDAPIIRRRKLPKKTLTKNRLVNSIGENF